MALPIHELLEQSKANVSLGEIERRLQARGPDQVEHRRPARVRHLYRRRMATAGAFPRKDPGPIERLQSGSPGRFPSIVSSRKLLS